jgi:hypothetical protein
MVVNDNLKPRQPRLIGEVVAELINSGLILNASKYEK